MSQATTFRDGFTQQSFGGLVREIRASISSLTAARRERARIVSELSTYSDRELGDLGVSRSDIHDIASGRYRR